MKHLLLVLLLVSTSVFAGNCDQHYVNRRQIIVPDTVELCNSFYVVAYSKYIKGPKVSFERFDSSKGAVKRINAFRPDDRLMKSDRAELKDYVHSGYDRGHMTPAADSSNDTEMRDTFLLSNMTPQSKRLNEGHWKDLETHIRNKSSGITYVATGALYNGAHLGDNKIGIPNRYFKVIWYADKTTEAFYADNKDDAAIFDTTIDKINVMTGLKFPK